MISFPLAILPHTHLIIPAVLIILHANLLLLSSYLDILIYTETDLSIIKYLFRYYSGSQKFSNLGRSSHFLVPLNIVTQYVFCACSTGGNGRAEHRTSSIACGFRRVLHARTNHTRVLGDGVVLVPGCGRQWRWKWQWQRTGRRGGGGGRRWR